MVGTVKYSSDNLVIIHADSPPEALEGSRGCLGFLGVATKRGCGGQDGGQLLPNMLKSTAITVIITHSSSLYNPSGLLFWREG